MSHDGDDPSTDERGAAAIGLRKPQDCASYPPRPLLNLGRVSTSMLDRNPSRGTFPHDATAVKHTSATLAAKLEVIMRFLSFGHKGTLGETGEGQDRQAESHMRRCRVGSDEVKESGHVTRAYSIRFPLHALVCF